MPVYPGARRVVANSEVILFWRRGVWTNFPENGFEQLNSLGWRAKGTYRNPTWPAVLDVPVCSNGHSERNACMKSTEAARQAGTSDAANARRKSRNAAPAITNGSNALTPKRNERTRRDAAKAPPSPIAQPTPTSFVPETITIRTI